MKPEEDGKAKSKALVGRVEEEKEALVRRVEEQILALAPFVENEGEKEAYKAYVRRRLEEEIEALMRSVDEEIPALAPSVEKEAEALAEEGLGEKKIDRDVPFGILEVDACATIGTRGESEKTAARQAMKAVLPDETTKERLKALSRNVEEPIDDLEEMLSDYEAWKAAQFRQDWIDVWSRNYGSFEDTTKRCPMRFTDDPAPEYSAHPLSTLQVFSVKVADIRGSLQWPIDVFGIVAVRDNIDYNRNIIFNRTRNNCQTLTKKDRYLVLAGPTRAVVWLDPVTIEVKLTVKGPTESEDKDLSFLAVPLLAGGDMCSYLVHCFETSKLSRLRFTLGRIVWSVEATIFVRVIAGSWPDGLRGELVAFTTSIPNKRFKRTDAEKIVLLDSGGENVLVTGNGEIELSRRVVSVETSGKLKVKVCAKAREASESDENVAVRVLVFTPKEANRSHGELDVGFCKMKVTVAWSLISYA
uniref:DUF6598 domain-containing protein n=1 Tax=Arundo donax TaxID=35708 RepID=A0A0A9ED02_ARUDO